MAVICFSGGFVYGKLRKVASTSTEVFLRQFCTGRDIATPLTARDEAFALARNLPALNFTEDHDKARAFYDLIAAGQIGPAQAARDFRQVIGNHASLMRIRALIGAETFAGLYKFATERHPYSSFISAVGFDFQRYNSGAQVRLGPDDYRAAIRKFCDREDALAEIDRMSNAGLYMENGKPLVDRLIRFEHLQDDLAAVTDRLGLVPRLPLPALKVVGGVDERLHALIPDDIRSRIRQANAFAFETLGYRG